jgi:acyl-ACP thioesterase
MIYRKDSYVSGSMCDCTTRLSVLAADGIVENAVTELMGDLKIDGIVAIEKYKAMWLFVKNSIHFLRRPAWREEFGVRSFISYCKGAKLDIDTVIESPEGEILLTARTELAAIDLESRKIRRVDTVGCTEDMVHPGEEVITFRRFPKFEAESNTQITVRSTDIDYCFHTNNIQYVRFVLDTYDTAWFKTHDPALVEIHYSGQSFEGETLDIGRMQTEAGDLFSIKRDGQEVTSCIINWMEK